MKKSVKIALSIILFLIVLAPLKNSIDNTKQRKNVSLFYSDVQNLNEKYNVLEQSDIWDENGKPVYSAFENRLIIKSDFVPTNNTADEIISGIGYVVLQYNDIDTLLVDYDMLNDKGYDVARDRIYYLSELSMTDAFDDNSSVDAFNSYGMIGEQYAKKIDFCSDEEIVIGVIDSGINYDHELFINRLDDADEPNFSSSGDRLSSADDNGHGTMVSGIILRAHLIMLKYVRISLLIITER